MDDLILILWSGYTILGLISFLLGNSYGKHNKIDIGMFLSYFKNEIKNYIY